MIVDAVRTYIVEVMEILPFGLNSQEDLCVCVCVCVWKADCTSKAMGRLLQKLKQSLIARHCFLLIR